MHSIDFKSHLAVCSWSLQPTSAAELVAKVKATGLHRIQIALDPIRENPSAWSDLPAQLQRHQMKIVSGMFVTEGEDYTTMETIKRTGGLVPDATWERNAAHAQKNAQIAQQLGIKLATFHAGFIPHDEGDPTYGTLKNRILTISETYARHGVDLAFETGQETAKDLNQFLRQLGRQNIGVNFDPANMLLYEKGDPIEALRNLAPWLRQCHLKDAIKTQQPGTWGQEVPVGQGQVDWKKFFEVLQEIQFKGDLCLEREAGTTRVEDIQFGQQFVQQYFQAA